MHRYHPFRLLQLIVGCTVVGIGVALLLTADLGSDGYSTLINGVARTADWAFWVSNIVVGVVFLIVAAARKIRPGLGTLASLIVVGLSASVVLDMLETPGSVVGQGALLAAALPVVAVGVALYLGTGLGAGPAEGAAQAWDPPLPFAWSYSILQFSSAAVGWLLGASVGAGTVVVVLLVGPLVDGAARLLGQDLTAPSLDVGNEVLLGPE